MIVPETPQTPTLKKLLGDPEAGEWGRDNSALQCCSESELIATPAGCRRARPAILLVYLSDSVPKLIINTLTALEPTRVRYRDKKLRA